MERFLCIHGHFYQPPRENPWLEAVEIQDSTHPYHVEQTAEALYQGLFMPEYKQQERMRSMRAIVRDFNVYRWAGRMLLDAARVRQREKLAMRIAQNY